MSWRPPPTPFAGCHTIKRKNRFLHSQIESNRYLSWWCSNWRRKCCEILTSSSKVLTLWLQMVHWMYWKCKVCIVEALPTEGTQFHSQAGSTTTSRRKRENQDHFPILWSLLTSWFTHRMTGRTNRSNGFRNYRSQSCFLSNDFTICLDQVN